MADDDCGYCDETACVYRFQNYNCRVRELEEIQKHFTKKEIDQIDKVAKLLESKKDDLDIHYYQYLVELVNDYNEKIIKIKEKD